MKRKLLCLLLAVVMSVSICSCGNANITNEDNIEKTEQQSATENKGDEEKTIEQVSDTETEPFEMYVEYDENNNPICLHITEEQLRNSITKVKVTTENWRDYFEDYDYVEHIENLNAFGDIESEYDEFFYGFRGKAGVFTDNPVAFKFDGCTELMETCWFCSDPPLHSSKLYYHAGDKFSKIVCETGKEYTIDCEGEDYCYVEVSAGLSYVSCEGRNYTDYNCLDVIGEIYAVDLPLKDKEWYLLSGMGSVLNENEVPIFQPLHIVD